MINKSQIQNFPYYTSHFLRFNLAGSLYPVKIFPVLAGAGTLLRLKASRFDGPGVHQKNPKPSITIPVSSTSTWIYRTNDRMRCKMGFYFWWLKFNQVYQPCEWTSVRLTGSVNFGFLIQPWTLPAAEFKRSQPVVSDHCHADTWTCPQILGVLAGSPQVPDNFRSCDGWADRKAEARNLPRVIIYGTAPSCWIIYKRPWIRTRSWSVLMKLIVFWSRFRGE